MKPCVHITLFGRFSVRRGDQVLLDHAPHRAQELLAYLVLHRGRPHPRETLAELLWKDAESPHARKYLRNALWQLHSGLVALGRGRAARLLRAEADWIELDVDGGTAVDADGIEQAFTAARGIPGEALPAEAARGLAEAVQLYRGDLLEGWPAEWCAYDRDRFRRMYLALLDKLADHHEARQGYEAAIAYATIALRNDAARERTHRSLIRLLAKQGDRTAALRQYERCVAALMGELGVEPEPETVVLRQLVRAGGIVGAVRESVPTVRTGAAAAAPVRPFTVVSAGTNGAAGQRPRPG